MSNRNHLSGLPRKLKRTKHASKKTAMVTAKASTETVPKPKIVKPVTVPIPEWVGNAKLAHHI